MKHFFAHREHDNDLTPFQVILVCLSAFCGIPLLIAVIGR